MMLLALMTLFAEAEAKPPEFYAANEELRGYLEESARNHPSLMKMHEEWLAALERIPQATSLDDPMFGFEYLIQSPAGGERYGLMLSQMFPWFGTLRTRGDKAAADAEAALQRLYAERNRIFARVKVSYFDYALLAENLRITESQSDILKYAEDIVNSRYSLGMGGQEDLLRIQIEETKLQDRYDALNQVKPALAAKLNEAIGREAAEDPPLPSDVPLPPAPPPAPVVQARLRVANPELGEVDSMIESAEHDVTLARKSGFPNFTFGLRYMDMKDVRNMNRPDAALDGIESIRDLRRPPRLMAPPGPGPNATLGQQVASAIGGARNVQRQMVDSSLAGTMDVNKLVMLENALDNESMKDQVGVFVEMNLPIWRKRVKAGIREAKHMEAAAEHEMTRRAIGLDAAARMAVFGMEDGLRRVTLFQDSLVPQAQNTYNVLQDGYASGSYEISFLDVLESIRTLLDFELEHAQAKRDLQVAAAELELILGGPWAGELSNESMDQGIDTERLPALPALEEAAPAEGETPN